MVPGLVKRVFQLEKDAIEKCWSLVTGMQVSRVGKGNDLVDNILVWIWGRRRAGLKESRDERRNTDGRKTGLQV